MTGAEFDLLHGHDILTREGFWRALRDACRLKEGAHALIGIPCSLWIYMSSSVHKRWQPRYGTYGDVHHGRVLAANIICINVTVILCVLVKRRVWWLIEQPGGSCQLYFNCLLKLLKFLGLVLTRKMKGVFRDWVPGIFTYMGFFGHWCRKPTRLVGTLPGAQALARKWNAKRQKNKRTQILAKLRRRVWFCKMSLVNRKKRMRRHQEARNNLKMSFQNSDGWVCGGKNMKESAGYTWRFAKHVCRVHVFCIKYTYLFSECMKPFRGVARNS